MFPFWKKKSAPGVAGRKAKSRRKGRGRRNAPPPSPEYRRYVLVATLVGLAVWSVATLTIVLQRDISSYNLIEGQIAPADIYSEMSFSHLDVKATERRREQARQAVKPVFRVQSRQIEDALRLLDATRQRLLAENQPAPLRSTPLDEALANIFDALAERDVLPALKTAVDKIDADALRELFLRQLRHGIVTDAPEDTFFVGMRPDDSIIVVDEQSRRITRTVDVHPTRLQAAAEIEREFSDEAKNATPAERQAIEILASLVLRPSLVFDADLTASDREEAARAVPEEVVPVEADVLLLERGTRVDDETLRLLNDHLQELERHRHHRHVWRDTLFFVGISLGLMLALVYMLYITAPNTLAELRRLLLLGVLLVFQLLLSRVFSDIYFARYSSNFLFISVAPLAVGAMLMSQLLKLRVTVVAIVYLSLVTSVRNDQPLQLFMVGFFSCLVGAMLFQRARKRSHSLQAAAGVAFVVVVVQVLFLVKNQIPFTFVDDVALLGLLNGFMVTAVAFTLLPAFEFLFGVTTDVSLLELSDLNHPLLKRLQLEAPGTYHHSLMVATLAEQAASAIGANPLRARVCAYFHDIGKLSQPEYFIENTAFGGQTPHDSLPPRMSSLVILNHVREGLALAERYKLRRVIREGIAQHHGTSLISFFYRRAKDKHHTANGERGVEARDYRYPGPTPTRKEVTLLCIADSCEAASRSLEKPTPQKIKNLVNEIVAQKIADGQLDGAELTFKEMALAKAAIVKTLVNMSHGRIAYPKDDETEDRPNGHSAAQKNPKSPADESPAATDGD